MTQNSKLSTRENFLMIILNKVISEYKKLLEMTRDTKPFKIVKITVLSSIPGESCFAIQIANKNCLLELSAAEIIRKGYNLDDFQSYHAEIIRQAAAGTLIEYLKIPNSSELPVYKIVAKKFDHHTQQFIFTIEDNQQVRFQRKASELVLEKEVMNKMALSDVFDVGYTQGSESIMKEQINLRSDNSL